MDKARSPRYPNISLAEAISRVGAIYQREHMSPASPQVMAEAMGYKGLNGTSLKVLSSLRKYALLEGRGEDLRVTRDAQTLILDPPDSSDFGQALARCALNPELFSDLRRQFPGPASERNIAVYLQKQGFKPDGAALCAKNYKDTMALLEEMPSAGHDELPPEEAVRPVASSREGAVALSGRGGINVRGEVRIPQGELVTELRPERENDIKVLLDGDCLRVAAWIVDREGLQRLKKAIDANSTLLLDIWEPAT